MSDRERSPFPSAATEHMNNQAWDRGLLRDDAVTMGRLRCEVCGAEFQPQGRQRWCSAACRQAAFRRRHQPSAPPLVLPRKPPKAVVVYQCPECEARYLGEQRCEDCRVFCRQLGPGGDCPHCGEPVAVADLLAMLGEER
jgi:hypothetical protein